MSIGEERSTEEVFSDTSVLLNYVLDQGDTGAFKLVTESDRAIVISENVAREFHKVPNRREDIYQDLLKIILSDGEKIEDIVISGREYLEGSDASFFESLRAKVTEEDGPEARLRRLREYQKIVDRRFGQTEEIISKICDVNEDEILRTKIGRVIGNTDDSKVVCDAVLWSGEGGNGDFATLDEKHILSNNSDINRVIRSHHGNRYLLNMEEPIEFTTV